MYLNKAKDVESDSKMFGNHFGEQISQRNKELFSNCRFKAGFFCAIYHVFAINGVL